MCVGSIQSAFLLLQVSLAAKTDPIFYHFSWKDSILEGSPKQWIVYVQMALFRSLPKYHLDYKHQTSTLHLIHKRIKNTYFQWYNYCINYCTNNKTVIQPAGNIHLEAWYKRFFGFYIANNFALSSELRLNISLIYINIRKVYQSCLRGNFSIQMSLSNKSEVSTLCGKHSSFIHYASTSKVSLILIVYGDILFVVDLKFSIMTKNIIFSKIPPHDISLRILYIHVILPLNINLTTFHLKVEKYQRICFTGLSFHQYTMIDGPLFKAPSVQMPKGSFCAATFQVILQVWNVSSYQYLQYTGKNFSFTKINVDKSIQYEHNDTDRVIDPVQFEVQHGFYLNLTFKSVYFTGDSFYDCKYGGICIYDDQHPLLDICENYGNESIVTINNYSRDLMFSSRPSRNVYSSNLMLVSYVYHPFTSLNFSIRVSSILCEPVRLDFCQLYHFFEDKWFPSGETFLKWLDGQPFTRKLQLKLQKYKISYYVPLGKCVIIHYATDYLTTDVTPDMVLKETIDCSLRLLLRHTSETNRVFTFNTRHLQESVSYKEYFENDDELQTPCWTGNAGSRRRSQRHSW